MTQNSENSNPLNPTAISLVHELCTKHFDQVISDAETVQFNNLLDNEPAARQLYLDYVLLHSMLLQNVGKQSRIEAELLGQHIDSTDTDDGIFPIIPGSACAVDTDSATTLFPSFTFIAGSIVTLLLIAAAASQWFTNSPAITRSDTHPATLISYVSPAVRWESPSNASRSGTKVDEGSTLTLAEGEVELTYGCGTRLLLIGPADFLVENAGGELRRGGLVASVTEAGHGFTIETPNGKVVDLGTEFGVAVDDFGASEVSVFQGKVEAFPQSGSEIYKKIELTKGDSLQWKQGDVISLEANLRKFASAVLGRQIVSGKPDDRASCVDRFRTATLDSKKWKSLGNVHTSAAGLVLTGTDASDNRPCLVSTEQFDPLQGPVTVTCDFRFDKIDPNGSPTFSLMTRSADHRGIAQGPWKGLLASCVRCSFRSVADSQEGSLLAGVKLESDTEMASVSWSGFLRPEPDTGYRVVMRDDGVNVSFTISLQNNPLVTQTVTCRSLFDGRTNYVSLEGAVSGTTIVERLEITQDRSAAVLSSYADFSSLLHDDSAQRESQRQQLADLAPQDAKLILQDDFATDKLDDKKWKSLGEVVMHNNVAQLGEPNATAHIDTLRARPYLLTRDRLDLNEGTLTITGKITFSDNFLAGYGASFSVMTRADDVRGSGPGWENSVLQRGIRANFWPAAWDTKHSLEIHEKPAANTVTLLAIHGVEVDPMTQLYLFRVVDDGKVVTLTIVDPRRPETEMTISSPTTESLKRGFVGFESCWGSPIMLDDVSIYQSTRDLAPNTFLHPN